MGGKLPGIAGSLLGRIPTPAKVAAGVLAAVLVSVYSFGSVEAANNFDHMVGGDRQAQIDPTSIRASYADVSFTTRDQVHLSGWLFQADPSAPKRRSVILVHGMFSNRSTEPMPELAKHYLDRGFDVLMFDLRGSGSSGNAPVTLGNKERFDVLAAYGFMKAKGYNPALMAVIGVSMGGAATIEASPDMPDVGAIVTMSTYARLEPLINAALRSVNPALILLSPGMEQYARLRWGINFDLAPVNVVRDHPERAFLFLHGQADDYIPPSNADELRRASANPQTKELLLPGIGHEMNATLTDNQIQFVDRFIDQQITEHSAPQRAI